MCTKNNLPVLFVHPLHNIRPARCRNTLNFDLKTQSMKLLQMMGMAMVIAWACKEEKKQKFPVVIQADKVSLAGTWQNTNSKVPDFRIESDSIVFLQEEPPKSFPVTINHDSLVIDFPTFRYGYKIVLFEGDSLQLFDEASKNSFVRLK